MFRMIQEKYFQKDICKIRSGGKKPLSTQLSHLNPVLDRWSGLLRVGGRLRNSALKNQIKHPIILPKKCVIIKRMIEWHHRRIEHLGRTSTLSELRQHGYFLINANAQVCGVIAKCVKCKKFRGQPATQKTADLQASRSQRRTTIQLLWSRHVWSLHHQRWKKGGKEVWYNFHVFQFSCHTFGDHL